MRISKCKDCGEEVFSGDQGPLKARCPDCNRARWRDRARKSYEERKAYGRSVYLPSALGERLRVYGETQSNQPASHLARILLEDALRQRGF